MILNFAIHEWRLVLKLCDLVRSTKYVWIIFSFGLDEVINKVNIVLGLVRLYSGVRDGTC